MTDKLRRARHRLLPIELHAERTGPPFKTNQKHFLAKNVPNLEKALKQIVSRVPDVHGLVFSAYGAGMLKSRRMAARSLTASMTKLLQREVLSCVMP